MLDAGQLREAAVNLASTATTVGILTGFCVKTPQGIAAETDGPPGALFLARALIAAGHGVTLISDVHGTRLLRAGLDFWRLERVDLVELPVSTESSIAEQMEHATERLLERYGHVALSHLISIERPGASHTLASLQSQSAFAESVHRRFLESVPEASRNRCHNMRGEPIDSFCAPAYWLFDRVAERGLPITTIGIGDGGNEIGMGKFDWATLVEATASQVAPRIISRVVTDFTLLGGTSDWAACALAFAFADLRGLSDRAAAWTAEAQRQLIDCLIHAGAVDGVTRRREATVDGLALADYLQPLVDMRQLLGLSAT